LPSAKTICQGTNDTINETKDRPLDIHKTNYISCLTNRLQTSEPAANVRSISPGKAVPGVVHERWEPSERLVLTTPKTPDQIFK